MPYVVSFVSARNLILQSVSKCMHSFGACTPIYEHQKDDAYWHERADERHGNPPPR